MTISKNYGTALFLFLLITIVFLTGNAENKTEHEARTLTDEQLSRIVWDAENTDGTRIGTEARTLTDDIIAEWEEATPIERDPATPIDWKPGHFIPTRRDWAAMRKSFAGDPLAFVLDPKLRADLEFSTAKERNPELARKKLALANYYANMRRERVLFAYDNLDSFIKQFHGKKLSIDAAYNEIKDCLFPHPKNILEKGLLIAGCIPEGIKTVLAVIAGIFTIVIVSVGIGYINRKIACMIESCNRKIACMIKSYKQSLGIFRNEQFFLYFVVTAIIMLLTGLWEWDNDGYYTFLRIITTISLAWFCFKDFPAFIRFIFLLGVILYNPVFPIYLGDRDIWLVFNVITVAALLAGGIAVIRKLKHKENVE